MQFWPRADLAPAALRWPTLFDEGVPEDYWDVVEHNLRSSPADLAVLLVPMRVSALADFLDRSGADVDDELTRQAYAEERVAVGDTLAWPPAPGEACWCGATTTYDRCCGRG